MKSLLISLTLLLCTITRANAGAAECDSLPVGALKELPVLWQQTSAEYRALCYQAFAAATTELNCIPKKRFRKERLALITDLDETILDNSYFEAMSIRKGRSYSAVAWKEWTNLSKATAVPGAVEFLQWAKQKGVSIFYISNRDTSELGTTIANLRALQLPDADSAHCLFMQKVSSKEIRRQQVMQDYRVVMLMGDNLNDFTTAFEKGSIESRFSATDQAKNEWGKKFIVLPNATYGEWENALYNYQRNMTEQQQESLRLGLLRGY